MNKRLSAKDQKALLDGVGTLVEQQSKMTTKAGAKIWPEYDVPLALTAALSNLSKSELTEIRKDLNLTGVSTLNKQQLIQALEQAIPAALSTLLQKFDETRFQIMKQIAVRGGYSNTLIDYEQLVYFESKGLIFQGEHMGKHTVIIPQEILKRFQDIDHSAYRETLKRNTEWIKLTHGLLFYYGYLDLKDLISLMEQYTGVRVDVNEYADVIYDAALFYWKINPEVYGFSNSLITDIALVKSEIEFRAKLALYPFTKNQLLLAGVPGFVDRNASHKAFVDFICKCYSISRGEADFIVEECADAIRMGQSPGKLLQLLQQSLEINDLELTKAFMNQITSLNNHTRQWFLKGYTPNELSSASKPAVPAQQPRAKGEVIDFATRTKVGRNDPCPCGSGKKHKKCCG
ncbi:SEC-C metal-binding domain-containing protein [Paenibacillus sp. SI8]|uniref:SEC-C metal-binding domain-containing protein n=1 Tax=unclassified Paenibacillus TaxID=185978 RepID=UPI003466806D